MKPTLLSEHRRAERMLARALAAEEALEACRERVRALGELIQVERERETFKVDCIRCFDFGVIHFTDLVPSKKHEPVPGERVIPLQGQVWESGDYDSLNFDD